MSGDSGSPEVQLDYGTTVITWPTVQVMGIQCLGMNTMMTVTDTELRDLLSLFLGVAGQRGMDLDFDAMMRGN